MGIATRLRRSNEALSVAGLGSTNGSLLLLPIPDRQPSFFLRSVASTGAADVIPGSSRNRNLLMSHRLASPWLRRPSLRGRNKRRPWLETPLSSFSFYLDSSCLCLPRPNALPACGPSEAECSSETDVLLCLIWWLSAFFLRGLSKPLRMIGTGSDRLIISASLATMLDE